MPRTAYACLVALTALRLVVAAWAPVSADEAYYWTWSRALAPGYLDHPPMVALWIRVGTWLAGEGALGVRLLGPFSALLGSILLARAGELLFPGRRVGLVAACLLNATLLLGIGSVTMTPDTPLLLFWTATLWAVAQLLVRQSGAWWLLVGAMAGGALLSKYTGALLGVGLAAWLLLVPSARRWLRTPWPWAGGGVALALFAPVVAWNAGHGWASFAKQGGRTTDWQPARSLQFLGELILGQVGLATPIVLALCAAGAWVALRQARRLEPRWALLAAMIWPGVLLFVQHALGDRVQANWPAILYPAAALAAAGVGLRFWRAAVAFGGACTLVVYAQATLAPLPLPRAADVTLIRLAGWRQLATEVESARQNAGLAWVAAEEYGLASQLARDLPGTAVVGVEPRWALFTFPSGQPALRGGPGLLVQSARRREPPDPARWRNVQPLGSVNRGRGGVVAETYLLYRAEAQPGAEASALLPHP